MLFRKINEGETLAQRQVALPQISLVILATETTEGTTTNQTVAREVVPRKDITTMQEIGTACSGSGTADIGTVPTSIGTTSTSAGMMPASTSMVPAGTGTSTVPACACIGTVPSDTGTVPSDIGTTLIGTSTAPIGKEARNIQMTQDDLEAVATLDTLTNEDVDASLDRWLGQFALAQHLPPSPAPHNMAIGARMTPNRNITISDLDGGRPVDREHQNPGSDKQGQQSSGPEGSLVGLHIATPNPSDPVG